MRRRQRMRGVVALVLGLAVTAPILAQEEEAELRAELEALKKGQQELQNQIKLMQEVEELKKGQAEIRKELEDIKRLLQQQQRAPARAAAPGGPDVEGKVFDIGTNPVLGENTAKLTLVEFTDYQ